MTIRPMVFETPTGHRESSWGVYDDDGRLLAPCGSREVAQKWRRLHERADSDAGNSAVDPLGGMRGTE